MCSKESLSETAWVSTYRDLSQTYSKFSEIFRHCWHTDTNLGSAVWNENFKLNYHHITQSSQQKCIPFTQK